MEKKTLCLRCLYVSCLLQSITTTKEIKYQEYHMASVALSSQPTTDVGKILTPCLHEIIRVY